MVEGGKLKVDENNPLALGMLGMHGTVYANYAVSECDLLIALGARFDDRVTGKLDEFACHAQEIHVDIDPAEVGKNRTPQKRDAPVSFRPPRTRGRTGQPDRE